MNGTVAFFCSECVSPQESICVNKLEEVGIIFPLSHSFIMENATKTANNRKKMKKIFVTLEKVCNFATDYGYLYEPLHGEIIRIR